MPLASISLNGYKGFYERADFAIRPITLVYGYNSAGKSSLLRLLPLVRDAVLSRGDAPFPTKTQSMRGASAFELFSKKADVEEMVLSFAFEGTRTLSCAEYHFRIFGSVATRRVVIERLVLKSHDGSSSTVSVHLPSLERGDYRSDEYIFSNSGNTHITHPFRGILPLIPKEKLSHGWAPLIEELGSELLGAAKWLWIGPLRSIPPRIERDDPSISSIDPNGYGTSDLLSRAEFTGGALARRVSEWFEKNSQYSLRVVRGAHEFGALHSLAFAPKADAKTMVPMEDTGEGIAQVLPILAAAVLASEGELGDVPTVLIEHPDLHLHSTVHGPLLDFFFEALKCKWRPRFILETHSEAMLLAVQLALVSKKISPEDVILHWVRAAPDGYATLKSIKFDELGYPTDASWPVFDWYASVHKQMQSISSARLLKK